MLPPVVLHLLHLVGRQAEDLACVGVEWQHQAINNFVRGIGCGAETGPLLQKGQRSSGRCKMIVNH